jgi:hypothetical protein
MKFTPKYLVLFFSLGLQLPLAHADDAPTKSAAPAKHHSGKKGMMQMEPTPEMRKKMAATHQKMADCLNSTKLVSECKKEMMADCPMMLGKEHCSMMKGMGDMPEMKGSED